MEHNEFLTGVNSSGNISFVYALNDNEFQLIDKELIKLLDLSADASPASISKLLKPAEVTRLKDRFKKLVAGKFSGSVEFKVKVNETELCLRLTPFIMDTPQGKYVLGNVTDITAEVNNRNAIDKYANKKNSILTMLAHDLRGPLGVARMITQTIGKTANEASRLAQSENLLKVLSQSVDLINDLIQREFDETVAVDLVKKPLDIGIKLAEYMEELRLSGDTIERQIKFESSPESIFANIDEGKFMQVMNNLVSNALKFTRDCDTISLIVKEQGDKVTFTFSDTGVGIPKKFQSELFEKFTPARRKGLHGEPTIGLGLSIIKTILDWHQGSIRVESEENKGTTFYFEIPKE